MKVLVPVDLVQPIEPIVALLRNMLPLNQASVKLLYVREMLPAYENVMKTVGDFPEDWEKQIEAKARALFDQVADKLKDVCKSIDSEVTHGPPAMMIEAVAQDEGFDLIVMTPSDRSAAERVFRGSVTNRVVSHAPKSLLIGRAVKNAPLKNVVIGFDGSKASKEALRRATELFSLAKKDVKVTVVYSVDIVEPIKFLGPVSFVSSLEQNLLMQGEAFLAQAEKQLHDLGVKNVECCLIEGNPAAELIKMANDVTADLIIMGSRGHTSVANFHLGSVSHKVAAHATSSVAVVHPD